MPIEDALTHLQQRLGYRFQAPRLLQRALTHRSAAGDHNERLEFLGDAVLSAAISAMLYQRFGDSDEGDLTRVRAHLVREESLHRAALGVGLPPVLRLSEGDTRGGGAMRPSILADALEAVVAAIYLDAGYEACRAVVLPWFEQALAALPEGRPEKDAKTRLQEWLQARQRPLPVYELVSESGEEHAKLFLARCTLTEPDLSAQGQGSSRRLAEQAAAAAALEALAPLPRQA